MSFVDKNERKRVKYLLEEEKGFVPPKPPIEPKPKPSSQDNDKPKPKNSDKNKTK